MWELVIVEHHNKILKKHLDLVDGKIIYDEIKRKFLEKLTEEKIHKR